MPLNYSKWDQLELSDDSDIEGHPNVDKRSLIRWKQRDIHEKREQRKHHIAHLRAQIDCNNVLLPRIQAIQAELSSPDTVNPSAYFNSLVERIEKNPSRDCPPGNDPSDLKQTYDGMVLDLLRQVVSVAREKAGSNANYTAQEKDDKLAQELVEGIKFHVVQLGKTIEKDVETLASEEKEQRKHITSDDLHDGFSASQLATKDDPPSVPLKKTDKPKKKVQSTEIEVLNPNASASTLPDPTEESEDEDALPELTPSLEGFSRIALRDYEKSFEYIQHHRDVVVPGASDALLVAAFKAQGEGKTKYAKQCVNQSLLLQYCEKLGKDGVGIFFKRMMSGGKQAEKVFTDDVEATYAHLVNRVKITKEEEEAAAGREQIQLVPESADQTISFNVPDGPPPDNLVLEGPGTEGLDIEEVRKALQLRWDVFEAFSEELQAALRDGSLDAVNKVLGDMEVPEAEAVVQQLDMAGILSFAEGGIRDETAQGRAEAGLPPKGE